MPGLSEPSCLTPSPPHVTPSQTLFLRRTNGRTWKLDSQLNVPVFPGDRIPHHDDQDQSQHGQELPACRARAQRSWRQKQAGRVPVHLFTWPILGPYNPQLKLTQSLDLTCQHRTFPVFFEIKRRSPGSLSVPPQPPGVPPFRMGSSWVTLTGLIDHVSQQVAGFLGRAGIPAASGHLESQVSGQLLTHHYQTLEEDTPTACLLPPQKAQSCLRAVIQRGPFSCWTSLSPSKAVSGTQVSGKNQVTPLKE